MRKDNELFKHANETNTRSIYIDCGITLAITTLTICIVKFFI